MSMPLPDRYLQVTMNQQWSWSYGPETVIDLGIMHIVAVQNIKSQRIRALYLTREDEVVLREQIPAGRD